MNGGNGGRAMESRGDVAVELLASQGRGGRQGMPEVSDADCQKVRDAFAKAPSAQTTLQGLRGRMQGGEIDQVRTREISDSIYKAAGLDGMVARACQARERAAQGGTRGGGEASGPTATTNPGTASEGGRSGRGGRGGGRRGGNNFASLAAGVDVPVSQARRAVPARAALVYVAAGSTFVPRVIRAGMSDLDYTEVVSGLEEGEQVVLLSALSMQARRDSAMQRMRDRSGGGMPGAPGGGGGGGRGRGC
jgi:hypothetical protein